MDGRPGHPVEDAREAAQEAGGRHPQGARRRPRAAQEARQADPQDARAHAASGRAPRAAGAEGCGADRPRPARRHGGGRGRLPRVHTQAEVKVAERRRLTAVARGAAPADLYVRGGTLLNVYTGELYPANVAVHGERVAYVGARDDMVGARTTVLDAGGRVLVPGYVDPHVHPAHVITPSALARHVLALGTTTLFADTLQFWELGGVRAFTAVADALARSPVKFYWMIRPHAQSRTTDEPRRFPLRDLARALAHPSALAARAVLTADGSMPAFVLEHGFVDHLIRTAMQRGVPPLDAYRMATLNPATYFGKDADLGGIAPGRYADICLLRDLSEPRPETVVARGRVAAREGRTLVPIPEASWRRVFSTPAARLTARWRARAADFRLPGRATFPVLRLVSAVITKVEERAPQPGDLHAALVDRRGRWVAPALVAGFADRLDGLASTISTDFNILTLGRRPESMARAVNRLLEVRGGVVLVDGDDVAWELPLPLGGIMTHAELPEAARHERELFRHLAERGYSFHDPFFTMLFLSADFLPAARLTPLGVWDVKAARVLLPSRRR